METGFEKMFEKQIIFLKKNFNFCYPEDFFEGNCQNGFNLLITFDDGYRDNYDIALPILKKYNIPTIFFISTKTMLNNDYLLHDKIRYLVQEGHLDKKYNLIPLNMYKGITKCNTNDIELVENLFSLNKPLNRRMMNANEIIEIYNNGFKIGNHTHSHIGLSFEIYNNQYEEIMKSNHILEKLLSEKVEHIAYPNGLYNSDTLKIVNDLGLKYGYSIKNGINKTFDSKLELKRIGINVSDTIPILLLKICLSLIKK